MKYYLSIVVLLILSDISVHAQQASNHVRAAATIDSIYKYFAIPGSPLLREHFPYDDQYKADYLGGGENANKANPYSYLWPFSGSLSAQVARLGPTGNTAIQKQIEKVVLKGLAAYYDTRAPHAYASYVNTAPASDRFYDDNIWLGIDFLDLYLINKNKAHLQKAEEIWAFIESGTDDKLGGGIYWCEARKTSKNTCSNAPGSVYALKLYEATKDKRYLAAASELYKWTKSNLQDTIDALYFDNINLSGRVDRTKYSYNSGQMLQAAVLLYHWTKEEAYLHDAKKIAAGCMNYFFEQPLDGSFPRLKNSNIWFHAVMLRGFVELYQIDKNPKYLTVFQQNMDFAWHTMRDEKGLFNKDWTGKKKDKKKGLLDQFAIVEMYARLAVLDPSN